MEEVNTDAVVAMLLAVLTDLLSLLETADSVPEIRDNCAVISAFFALISALSLIPYFERSAAICPFGIYNNINPPERYLEQTYSTYAGQLNTALSELEYDINSSASADVNKAVNGIISKYTSLSSELDILDSLSEACTASAKKSGASAKVASK